MAANLDPLRWSALVRALVFPLAIAALAGAAESQALRADREDGDGVAIEVHKPVLRGDDQPFPASVTFLGVRRILRGGRLALVVDLPIAHARIVSYQYEYVPPVITPFDTVPGGTLVRSSETVGTEIANPYLGIEFPGAWTHEIGIRIERGSRNNERLIGFAAEVERMAAFAFQTNTLHYGLAYRPPREDGLGWRSRFALLLPVSHGVSYLLTYQAMAERGYGRYRLGLGLAGIISVDPSNHATLDSRMLNQLEAVAEGSWGSWRPALHLRRWLDADLRDEVPIVIGLRMEWRPDRGL